MDEGKDLAEGLESYGQVFYILTIFFGEVFGGPLEGEEGIAVEGVGVEPAQHAPVVVAGYAEVGVASNGLYDFIGLGAVADKVAQTPERVYIAHFFEDGAQGNVIAVNV